MKNERIYLRINEQLKLQLENQAKQENRTLSNLIETVLKNYIEEKGIEIMYLLDFNELEEMHEDNKISENKMILEIAYVKYNSKGEYDHTVESTYLVNTKKELKKYVNENLEKNHEYYFYNSFENLQENFAEDGIVANKKIKES